MRYITYPFTCEARMPLPFRKSTIGICFQLYIVHLDHSPAPSAFENVKEFMTQNDAIEGISSRF